MTSDINHPDHVRNVTPLISAMKMEWINVACNSAKSVSFQGWFVFWHD